MVQINDRVLTAATQRGQNLLNEEVVALIERYHPHEQPGISREALEAYATALANEPNTDSMSGNSWTQSTSRSLMSKRGPATVCCIRSRII